ncbi:MAG: 4-hydroxy-tetrahydrodipicolinate reductase [Gammaproteobacteria bacterium]
MSKNILLVGASGRMGLAITRAVAESRALRIVAAVDRPDDGTRPPVQGRDLGTLAGIAPLGVAVGADIDAALAGRAGDGGTPDVMIDFSSPAATASNLAACARARVAALVGTTGLGADVEAAAQSAAAQVPVLIAANTSVGVTLLAELVRAAARVLPAEFDIEITDAHHRAKVDAPSGTALVLGRAAAEGRGIDHDAARLPIDRHGARRSGGIGYSVVRAGDIVGEHEVIFAAAGERVVLGHIATDRNIFARGALRAADWLSIQPAGRYSMVDFLGLKTVV